MCRGCREDSTYATKSPALKLYTLLPESPWVLQSVNKQEWVPAYCSNLPQTKGLQSHSPEPVLASHPWALLLMGPTHRAKLRPHPEDQNYNTGNVTTYKPPAPTQELLGCSPLTPPNSCLTSPFYKQEN